MSFRPNSLLALVGVTVLFVALAVVTSAAGRPSPQAIATALVLLGVIGVRAVRVAHSGRITDWDEPKTRLEQIDGLTQGLIVLGWTVIAVVAMGVIAFVSTVLELEGEASSIAGLLALGSFLGILIGGPVLTLRYLMRRSARRP
jgi:uncharacterized membrane protein